MKEPKFTKGPWRLFGYEVKVKVNFGDGWFQICRLNVFNQAKANAALIAAAPDIYATLESVLSEFDYENSTESDYEVAKRIKSVLAKARGES